MKFRRLTICGTGFLGLLFLTLPTPLCLADSTDKAQPADIVANLPQPPEFAWQGIWSEELVAAKYSPEELETHTRALNRALQLVLGLPSFEMGTPASGDVLTGRYENPLQLKLGPQTRVEGIVVMTHGASATGEVAPNDEGFQTTLSPDTRSLFDTRIFNENPKQPFARSFYPFTVFRVDAIAALPPGRTEAFSHDELVARYLPEVLVRLFAHLAFHLEFPPQNFEKTQSHPDQILYQLEFQRRAIAVLFKVLKDDPFGTKRVNEGPLQQAFQYWTDRHDETLSSYFSLTSHQTGYVVPFGHSLHRDPKLTWNQLSSQTLAKIRSIQGLTELPAKAFFTRKPSTPFRWTSATWPLYKKSISFLYLTRAEWTQWTSDNEIVAVTRSDEFYGWFVILDDETGEQTLCVTYFIDNIFLSAPDQFHRDAFLRWAKAFGRSHGGTIQAFLETPYRELNRLHLNPHLTKMENRGFATSVGLLNHLNQSNLPQISWAEEAEKNRLSSSIKCLQWILAAPHN